MNAAIKERGINLEDRQTFVNSTARQVEPVYKKKQEQYGSQAAFWESSQKWFNKQLNKKIAIESPPKGPGAGKPMEEPQKAEPRTPAEAPAAPAEAAAVAAKAM